MSQPRLSACSTSLSAQFTFFDAWKDEVNRVKEVHCTAGKRRYQQIFFEMKDCEWTFFVWLVTAVSQVCGDTGKSVNLGPLHVSPVDRTGSVFEILPRCYFLCKYFDVFILINVFIWARQGRLTLLPRSRFFQPISRYWNIFFSPCNSYLSYWWLPLLPNIFVHAFTKRISCR